MIPIDGHPKLEPPTDDVFEIGWIAARLYTHPDKPDTVSLSWTSEGLDVFRQIGIVDAISIYLDHRMRG